jgi:hypothetical protein
VPIYEILQAGSKDGSSSTVALYVNSRIVCGPFRSWQGAAPQSCERSILDCAGFYTIHTFLNPLVERQFESFLKLIISVFNYSYYYIQHSSCYHLLPQLGTLHLTSRVCLRLAIRTSTNKKAAFIAAELEKFFGFVSYPEVFHTGVYTILLLLTQ